MYLEALGVIILVVSLAVDEADTGPGPYTAAPPMYDPMQHGQSQPYPLIVPPQWETKSQTVSSSMETKPRGDGFCRGFCAGLCCYCCLDICF